MQNFCTIDAFPVSMHQIRLLSYPCCVQFKAIEYAVVVNLAFCPLNTSVPAWNACRYRLIEKPFDA